MSIRRWLLLTICTVLRDVSERGRDVEGCIKQWFAFVKPNLEAYVEPQRKIADIIVPRGIENTVAISESCPLPTYLTCSLDAAKKFSYDDAVY